MNNVLFDRETLKIVGSNRSPLPFEVEIQNVELVNLPSKTVTFYELEDKKDENGKQLYYFTFTFGDDDGSTHKETLEITNEDPKYASDLEKVKISVEKTKQVSYETNPEEYGYADVVALKQKQITNETFFGQGLLFEEMSAETFSTNLSGFNADLGFGFISLPSGGEVRTVKLSLPDTTDLIGVRVETSAEGIEVSLGSTASNLLEVTKGEISLESPVSEVYVKFENPTDKRIDIYSFALLV